ncbi:hypothetical protein PAXRUDRAFT_346435 [Paxillus rubicundulus Ve08.2h10]|uniref:Uncharacterized protein n=1 Tax=Paxillus rubicundulus Ve08.2h10 TaxID=930991 RepID=A0A0D0E9Q2_9AGAM|nr:hypothetical protein PAXRUDRAFT_346435 [Paxillus rubicundulus Ve08.2h10]
MLSPANVLILSWGRGSGCMTQREYSARFESGGSHHCGNEPTSSRYESIDADDSVDLAATTS